MIPAPTAVAQLRYTNETMSSSSSTGLGYGDLWLLGKIGVLPPLRHYWRGLLLLTVVRLWWQLMADWWIKPALKQRGILAKTSDERMQELLQTLRQRAQR